MPFRLWLLKTAHQRLVLLERAHIQAARRAVDRELPLPDSSSIELARQLAVSGPSPSDVATQRECAGIVRRCLARLDDRDREVLLLRIFDGLKNSEVAAILELNPETTKKRFARALLRLKHLLRDAGLAEEPQ
jgi:RNA polymerase sigma factor (sigma-70 family)